MTVTMSARRAASSAHRGPRVRFSFPALIAAGCVLLSATTPGVTGPTPGAAPSGTLVMREQSHGHTCTSDNNSQVTLDASSCAAVNELGDGAPMIPGHPIINHITITNTGTTPAKTIALTAVGNCIQTPSSAVTDLCDKVFVTVTSGTTTVFTGTAKSLGHAAANQLRMPAPPAAQQAVEFTFTAILDPAAGNSYMGLEAQLPISWTLTA